MTEQEFQEFEQLHDAYNRNFGTLLLYMSFVGGRGLDKDFKEYTLAMQQSLVKLGEDK
ncbi:TPA: hypothetical protein QCP92_002671 [Bacillus cereus]|nr:hypothetical protein [Bacillus cereus]